MLECPNHLSRLGENVHIDPLLQSYFKDIRLLNESHKLINGEINPQKLPGARTPKNTFCNVTNMCRELNLQDDIDLDTQITHIPIQYTNTHTI